MIYDLVVVGNGIAAKLFLFELSKIQNLQFSKILQIYSEEFAPPCSQSTTSIVSTFGIEKPNTELAYKIYNGFQKFLGSTENDEGRSNEPINKS